MFSGDIVARSTYLESLEVNYFKNKRKLLWLRKRETTSNYKSLKERLQFMLCPSDHNYLWVCRDLMAFQPQTTFQPKKVV